MNISKETSSGFQTPRMYRGVILKTTTLKPTPEQLRDFFKSDIFQMEHLEGNNYEKAIEEFYRRFYGDSSVNEPLPHPRKWQTAYVRKYSVKAFLRTKDGTIHHVIFKQGIEANQILNFDGTTWQGDPNSLDVWQEYYETDRSLELTN
jgi:hypothetical protein